MRGNKMPKVYSNKETAEVLLQLIDGHRAYNSGDFYDTGIDNIEYIGQGINKIYVERDTLLRVAGRLKNLQ